MTESVETVTARRMPRHLIGRWLTVRQLIWAVPVGVLCVVVYNSGAPRLYALVCGVVWIVGWMPFEPDPGYLMPWHMAKRGWLWWRGQAAYRRELPGAVKDDNEPSARALSQLQGVRHVVMPYLSPPTDPNEAARPGFSGLFVHGNKATAMFEVPGWHYDHTDPTITEDGRAVILAGLKDVVNTQSRSIQLGSLYVVSGDNVDPRRDFYAQHAVDPASPDLEDDPKIVEKLSWNVTQGEIEASGPSVHHIVSVQTQYPSGWKAHFGRDPQGVARGKKPQKLLRQEEVMRQNPFTAMESMLDDWRRVSRDPAPLDLLDQIVMIHGVLDPLARAELAWQLEQDRADIAAGRAHALDDLQLVRRSAFPARPYVGHDWLRPGRTLLRTLVIEKYRREYYTADYFIETLRRLGLPCAVGFVGATVPHRWEETRREQKLMLAQDMSDIVGGSEYRGGSMRTQQRVEDNDLERQEMFYSGAPGVDALGGIIVHGASLAELSEAEEAVKKVFSAERITLDAVTGAENQLPYLMYLLNLYSP